MTYALGFLLAVIIGSLIPDADCGGNAKLHYDFQIVDDAMKKLIMPLVIYLFKIISKKKATVYEVKEEHRGIMHAPAGIILSSIILTLLGTILLIIFKLFSFILLIIIFIGVLIGQLLHILEDSCTIAGINWKFPFGDKIIAGKIHTWNRRDARPMIYEISLFILSGAIFLLYAFNKISLNLWVLYPLILIAVTLFWFIFIGLSKLNQDFWTMSEEVAKGLSQFKRRTNKEINNYSKNGQI